MNSLLHLLLKQIRWVILFFLLTACGQPAATPAPPSPTPVPVIAVSPTPQPAEPSLTPTPAPPATPTPEPATPTPMPPSPTPAAPPAILAAELQATVAAGLPPTSTPDSSGFSMGGFDGVQVLPLETAANSSPLWAVFSYGFRSFEPLQNHFVAIYTLDGTTWQEVSRLELENPDYIDPGSVQQVQLEPSRIWLEVQSGAGAHAGCYDLLTFADQTLQSALAHCHESPGAGQLEDLNGDGVPEVLLNLTNSYVFCYACGVRLVAYQVMTWAGSQLSEVTLTPLPESAPAELHDLNNRAVELAQAGLWRDAQETIRQALALDAQDPTVAWNGALIDLHAEAQAEQAASGAYPLLDHVFYGDYAAALEVMRPYPVEDIFKQPTPLIAGTVAEGWEAELSQWLVDRATGALQVEPELAAAYFLRGWGTHLSDPGSPEALADIERAAELAPDEPLFSQSAAYLKSQ